MNMHATTSEALSHAAGSPPRSERAFAPWSLSNLMGRLVEVTGRARLSMAVSVVLGAQQRHEPVAWVAAGGSLFFPEDVAETGIDLEAMPLVRVKSAAEAARAADLLLRSGAFGLVVLDLGTADPEIPMALQSRLVGLAQKHQSALLCLTEQEAERYPAGSEKEASGNGAGEEPRVTALPPFARKLSGALSSLVSLRVEAWRKKGDRDPSQLEERFACGVTAMKDKSRGPGWSHEEMLRGPSGLR